MDRILYEKRKRIREQVKNPRYIIMYKGKEVRRYAFFRQAKNYLLKHNSLLFAGELCSIVDTETGVEAIFWE